MTSAGGEAVLHEVLQVWAHRPPSEIHSHDAPCCRRAKAWLRGMSFGAIAAGESLGEPRWVAERFEWGPVVWPLHWCDVLRADSLDCGALADVSRYSLEVRGIEACHVQLVEKYSRDDRRHWAASWQSGGLSLDWSIDGLTYHEAVGVVVGDSIRVWDATRNAWRDHAETSGYGSIAAVRYWGQHPRLSWGPTRLRSGAWHSTATT